MCPRVGSIGLCGLVLVAMALAVPAVAWAQAASLDLLPNWKAGDIQTMELVRQREQTRGAEETRRITTRVDIDIRVLAAGSDGSVVQWAFGEVRFDEPEQAKDPGVAELLGMAHRVRYELEVDPSGAIRQLRNWTEVRALARGATARLLEQLRQRGVTGQTRSAISERIGALYSSEQQILSYSLREASLYHAAFGKRYELSTPITANERLPNALGGESFPATTSFTLTRLDDAARRAVIEWKQTLDPAAARRIMLKTMTDLAARMRRLTPSEADVPQMVIEGAGEVVADIDTGWLKSLRQERTARVGPSVQVDTSTLTEKAR